MKYTIESDGALIVDGRQSVCPFKGHGCCGNLCPHFGLEERMMSRDGAEQTRQPFMFT